MHDEMLIKADLVFDQRSGEMVGFLNNKEQQLATHVLAFYVVGINSNLGMSVAYFPTHNATADQLFPLFWKTVGYLETFCGLKVPVLL